jgi:flagellar protein FliT
MLNNDEVMSLYENVSRLTAAMLQAAKQQDWEQLDALEAQCSHEISILKTKGPATPFFGALRVRKIEILEKIMRDDRAIRDATQPWMNELQALIHNTGTRRKLEQRYSAS